MIGRMKAWLSQTSTRCAIALAVPTIGSWGAGDLDTPHAIAALGVSLAGMVFNDRTPPQ